MTENISQKSKNNAAISYWILFFSWLLFFNKKNPDIDNDFVKKHIRSSIVLHWLILLNYIIFISFGLFRRVWIFDFSLNIIIANILFFIILFLIIKWIYDAINWKEPNIWKAIKMTTSVWLDINNDNTYDEKDKLSIILAFIPFLWYISSSKYNNDKVQNIIKTNILASAFILFVYILWYNNITNLLSLIYIIYIVFWWVYLYTKDTLISFSFPEWILPNKLLIKIKSFIKYLNYYFKWDFKKYEIIEQELITKNIQERDKWILQIDELEDLKLNKNLIYIPILNFIFLFQKENKYIYHIRNWVTISYLFIFAIILSIFGLLASKSLILFLYPICFGIWLINKKYYKMPFIYEIYEAFRYLKNIFFKSKQKIDEKRKTINEVNLKIEE